jgi:glycosyltransferase involved in cell wall biosynthesis
LSTERHIASSDLEAQEFPSATSDRVVVVGRFPPPLDGQAIATRKLARLLESFCDLRRVDVSTGESALAESDVRFRSGRVSHYFACRKRLKATARSMPEATVLWTGISASTLGHYRDLTVVFPNIRRHDRVYGVVHWGNFDELFTRLSTRFTAGKMVEQLSGLVFLNETLRERSSRWIPPEKQFVIPNTIEESIRLTDNELNQKRVARQQRTVFRMLYLGSMTASKGWADGVRAVEILTRQNVPIQFDLVGRWESDEAKIAFSDYITHHGLSKTVLHHGAVSNRSQIKALFAEADAFILPTYYPTEAQPLTIIEALNTGTPVITTRHAGIPEMIDQNVEGFFVEPKQPEAIAAAVQQITSFEDWRSMSEAARDRFNRQFEPGLVRSSWLKLVQSGSL